MDIRKYFQVTPINNIFLNNNNKCNNIEKESEEINTNHIVFTDGSTFNNGSKKNAFGGIGVFYKDNDSRNISKILTSSKVTNNVAEILACIYGIEGIINLSDFDKKNRITVYTDSQYTINSITKWAKTWESNGWKRKQGNTLMNLKNKEIIQKLYKYYNIYNINFIHIRAHTKEPEDKNSKYYKLWYGNNMADQLARNASLMSKNNH